MHLLDFLLARLEAGWVGVGGAAGHLVYVGRKGRGEGWLGSIRGNEKEMEGGKAKRLTQVIEEIMLLLLPCCACGVYVWCLKCEWSMWPRILNWGLLLGHSSPHRPRCWDKKWAAPACDLTLLYKRPHSRATPLYNTGTQAARHIYCTRRPDKREPPASAHLHSTSNVRFILPPPFNSLKHKHPHPQ